MTSADRWSKLLGVVRAAGLLSVFTLAIAGNSNPAIAENCEDFLIACHWEADDCVENVNEDCGPYGCEGKRKCDLPGDWGCHEEQFAEVCKFDVS